MWVHPMAFGKISFGKSTIVSSWELFGAYAPSSGLVPFPPIREVRRLIDEAIATNSSIE